MFNFKKSNISKIIAASILIGSTAFAISNGFKKAQATTNPSGLTGKYGCMMSSNVNGFGALYQSLDSSYTFGLVATAIINYDNNTVSTLSGEISNYNKSNPKIYNYTSVGTFTEIAIPNHNGVYKATGTLTDVVRNRSGTMTFISIPVNSGNTILVTDISDNTSNAPWTGVCQKI